MSTKLPISKIVPRKVVPRKLPKPAGTAPSRPSDLRQVNARSLLHLLRRHTPCSKADLVRLSGLSAPTVSSAVAHLERIGLIELLGEGASSGGRPPGLLRFKARHGYVAAADIGGTRLRMMLADLSGDEIAHWSTVLLQRQKTPEAICGLVRDGLKAMCAESHIALHHVLHLTAGAPGITNVSTGVVLSAPNLAGWQEVPLRDLLERQIGLPVIVENDTNLAAVGEYRRGAAETIDNFVFIAMGTGVGAGIFLRGELHHGAQWSAGEIGYFGVSGRKREPMRMCRMGQLEGVIGGDGIEEEWRRLLGRRAQSRPELARLRATQIFDLAADGDALAKVLVRHVAGLMADAVADISLLLNPQLVVLGGGVGSHPELCRETTLLLQRHELAQPEIRSSALGTRAQLCGAISLSIVAAEARLLSYGLPQKVQSS